MNIYKELGDWYVGCTVKDKNTKGVFPKSYVKVKNENCQQHIVEEITTVVREWGTILKRLYIVS